MGFLRQTEKKKKKEQRTPERNEMEKTMFLSPEERMGTQRRGAKHSSQENGEDTGYSSTKIVRGNPIIINGPDYLLRISETRMEAFLILYRRFTEKEIRDLLQENGIAYGIKEKALEELAQGKLNYEEVFVAQGTAKKDGRDGYFEYHFNPYPETRPIILPDGSVDYNVLGKMELVTKGQLLATYHAVLPAVVGRDVYGNIMEAYEGKELQPLQCKRCEPDESGCQYFASTEGNVTLEGKCLTVTPIYAIDGNLDAATGDVDFHGDVLVQGNVFAGVTLKTTGTITVNGHVETAHLFAGKDVILKNGMQRHPRGAQCDGALFGADTGLCRQ